MPHSFGYRARTRNLFARGYRKNGVIPLTTYLTTYKIGDYVDIKANGAVHKGMPHKFYHGKTGVVWNVTPRAVGVEVNKRVGNRIMKKRIHVRVEHVQPSKCNDDFLKRCKETAKLNAQAKKDGVKISTKRQPTQPREGAMVRSKNAPVNFTPDLYEFLM